MEGDMMKLKKIKLEGNLFFGNAEFDFTDASGNIMDNIVFAGENGCGKTQLLNLIYDFSTITLNEDSRNEKQIFTIFLSEEELMKIDQDIDESNKLEFPVGEIEIIKDLNVPKNDWQRYKIKYYSKQEDGSIILRDYGFSYYFLHSESTHIVFMSLFSTVEINYNPKEATTVTSKDIDQTLSSSIKSGDDLATDIQQLLIDIQDIDANELQVWVNDHPGDVPPHNIISKRISRFKKAFECVFDNLNFSRIVTKNGKKVAYFKKDGYDVDISSLSSGEKQIVFRGTFLLSNQQSAKGSIVLVDEPEISLHPTWQTKIFDYYRNLFIETTGVQTSQLFYATHSQYVLRSALENRNNTAIVLLNHVGTTVEIKKITAPLVLPTITSAELNYVAFNIVSNDYHIELYGYLQNKIAISRGKSVCSVKECDTYITQQTDYDTTKHSKSSSHTVGQRTTHYDTLCTYIRNAIDHPNPNHSFTPQELRDSIEILIKLCH